LAAAAAHAFSSAASSLTSQLALPSHLEKLSFSLPGHAVRVTCRTHLPPSAAANVDDRSTAAIISLRIMVFSSGLTEPGFDAAVARAAGGGGVGCDRERAAEARDLGGDAALREQLRDRFGAFFRQREVRGVGALRVGEAGERELAAAVRRRREV